MKEAKSFWLLLLGAVCYAVVIPVIPRMVYELVTGNPMEKHSIFVLKQDVAICLSSGISLCTIDGDLMLYHSFDKFFVPLTFPLPSRSILLKQN